MVIGPQSIFLQGKKNIKKNIKNLQNIQSCYYYLMTK